VKPAIELREEVLQEDNNSIVMRVEVREHYMNKELTHTHEVTIRKHVLRQLRDIVEEVDRRITEVKLGEVTPAELWYTLTKLRAIAVNKVLNSIENYRVEERTSVDKLTTRVKKLKVLKPTEPRLIVKARIGTEITGIQHQYDQRKLLLGLLLTDLSTRNGALQLATSDTQYITYVATLLGTPLQARTLMYYIRTGNLVDTCYTITFSTDHRLQNSAPQHILENKLQLWHHTLNTTQNLAEELVAGLLIGDGILKTIKRKRGEVEVRLKYSTRLPHNLRKLLAEKLEQTLGPRIEIQKDRLVLLDQARYRGLVLMLRAVATHPSYLWPRKVLKLAQVRTDLLHIAQYTQTEMSLVTAIKLIAKHMRARLKKGKYLHVYITGLSKYVEVRRAYEYTRQVLGITKPANRQFKRVLELTGNNARKLAAVALKYAQNLLDPETLEAIKQALQQDK